MLALFFPISTGSSHPFDWLGGSQVVSHQSECASLCLKPAMVSIDLFESLGVVILVTCGACQLVLKWKNYRELPKSGQTKM